MTQTADFTTTHGSEAPQEAVFTSTFDSTKWMPQSFNREAYLDGVRAYYNTLQENYSAITGEIDRLNTYLRGNLNPELNWCRNTLGLGGAVAKATAATKTVAKAKHVVGSNYRPTYGTYAFKALEWMSHRSSTWLKYGQIANSLSGTTTFTSNYLRNLVSGGLVEKGDRGMYRISQAGIEYVAATRNSNSYANHA